MYGFEICMAFQRWPLKFHTTFWYHTPQNMNITRCQKFDNYDILELCPRNSLWHGSLFLLRSDVCRPKNWSDWVFLRSWWRHQVETFSALLDLCEGNPSVTGGFPSQSQWRGALMFSLIYVWTNGWTNNRDTGDLRCHRAHYDVIVIMFDTRCVIDKLTHVYGSVYTPKCCLNR